MPETIKLKGKELFYLLLVTIPPLLLLFIPNYAAILVGIDSWAVFVLIALIDIIFAFIIVKIGYLAPDKTVIGMCRYAFGNAFGAVFGSLFVLLFGFKSMMFFRQALEYVYMSTYNLEPLYYYAVPMILIITYGQLCGSKNILRLSNIVFWLMMATYFLVMLSAVRNFELKSLMPVFADGVNPVIYALPHFFTWSGNVVVLLMFFNKTQMKKGVMKHVMTACGIAYAIVIVLNILFIGVFGVISGFITTSVLELPLFLNSQVFFNNFDSLIKLIWVFGTFIRDCIFISCTVDSLCELLKITNKKAARFIVPVILTFPTLMLVRNEEVYFMIGMGISSTLCAAVQYGCVLILLIGLLVKKKSRTGSADMNNEVTEK